MNTVHVVVPAGIDDPARPSGGNVYDRRVCNALLERGWTVLEHHVEGAWPSADSDALEQLTKALSAVPDDGVVLVDGLIASVSGDVLVPEAGRLRVVVLMHMPIDAPGERAVLAAARAVITTSRWTRTRLLSNRALDAGAVRVAEPGVEPADAVVGRPGGENLLCVGPVSWHKGQDVLLSALAEVQDLTWSCRVVGSLERQPQFVAGLRRQSADCGLADRVELCGALAGPELARAYADADLLVHPSRGETYGMVVTEALAHALPVVAADVGGLPEALGDTPDGRPGLLVPVDDPRDLADALRTWLTDEMTRSRLRSAAIRRRQTLTTWETTAGQVSQVLAAVAP